jgi:diguanylate cyclase (GGDEF)-like protein
MGERLGWVVYLLFVNHLVTRSAYGKPRIGENMTDLATVKDQTEPFWNRVRQAVLGSRPLHQEKPMGYGQAAMARSLGLRPKLGNEIDQGMIAGWNAARERHVSLSLVVIEVDRFADYFAAYGKDQSDNLMNDLQAAINECLPRPSDVSLRMGRSGFVLVFPDLPALMARATAAKINDTVKRLALAHKESHAGVVTLSMGVAVTNPQGPYDKKFFEAGAETLKRAQRKGIGRIEGVDLRSEQDRKRKAA